MASLAHRRSRLASAWSTRRRMGKFTATASVTLFALAVLLIFLAPLAYMSLTALKTQKQVQDPDSQFLPGSPTTYNYEGKDYPLLKVPTEEGVREWALFKPGREASDFIDPASPAAGPIHWVGRWRVLDPAYHFDPSLDNFYRWSARSGLPRHYFVDGAGTVVREVIGPLAPARMAQIIEELLGPA